LTAKPLLIIGNRNYSSWSLRAWLVAAHAGIEFDVLRIPLFVDGFEQAIRQYSPAGKVPILRDGEVLIWDSLAIAEYLAEKYSSLWPADPAARAHARSVAAEMHAGFAALREALPMNCRAMDRRVAVSGAAVQDIGRITQLVEECRRRYAADGAWLFGDFSIADAMYAPIVSRFQTYGIDGGRMFADYAATLLGDPKMLEWYAAAEAEEETIELAEAG